MNHPFSQLPLSILVLLWIVLRPTRQSPLTTYMEIARYQLFLETLRSAFPEPDQRSRLQAFAVNRIDTWITRQKQMIETLQSTGLVVMGWLPIGK